MALPNLQTIEMQNPELRVLEPVTTISDYVFATGIVLPVGSWELSIEKGDAWIFCERGNFVMHTDDTIILSEAHGQVCIKRLYVKGSLKFRAVGQPS